MLFKDKYFEEYTSSIRNNLTVFSENSAASILIIWDAVRHQFYRVDLAELTEKLHNCLCSNDIVGSMSFHISEPTKNALRHEPFRELPALFYHYYFHRLPVLFRTNIVHNGRRRRISRKEVDATVEKALQEYSKEYGSTNMPLCPEEYHRFDSITGILTRSKTRDDHVYSIQWLWDGLNKTYSELLQANNISSITTFICIHQHRKPSQGGEA